MHIPSHRSLEAVGGPSSSPVAEREPTPFNAVLESLARLLVGVDAHRKARRTAAELTALDDRLLADVGLRRSDLPRADRGSRPVDHWRRIAACGPR